MSVMACKQDLTPVTCKLDSLSAVRPPDPSGSGFEACHVKMQIGVVLTCLKELGPWCAAAACFLDLLAPSNAAVIPANVDETVGFELQVLVEDTDVGGDHTWEQLR